MSGALKGVSRTVGGVGGIAGAVAPATAKILSSLNVGPSISGLLSDIIGAGAQRERFVAVLLATVDHVNKKQNFNIELEINDLLVRLGNLRNPGGGAGGPGGTFGGLSTNAQLTSGLEKLLQDMVNGATPGR